MSTQVYCRRNDAASILPRTNEQNHHDIQLGLLTIYIYTYMYIYIYIYTICMHIN